MCNQTFIMCIGLFLYRNGTSTLQTVCDAVASRNAELGFAPDPVCSCIYDSKNQKKCQRIHQIRLLILLSRTIWINNNTHAALAIMFFLFVTLCDQNCPALGPGKLKMFTSFLFWSRSFTNHRSVWCIFRQLNSIKKPGRKPFFFVSGPLPKSPCLSRPLVSASEPTLISHLRSPMTCIFCDAYRSLSVPCLFFEFLVSLALPSASTNLNADRNKLRIDVRNNSFSWLLWGSDQGSGGSDIWATGHFQAR